MKHLLTIVVMSHLLAACGAQPDAQYAVTSTHPRYACVTGDMMRASSSARPVSAGPTATNTRAPDCNAHILHASLLVP